MTLCVQLLAVPVETEVRVCESESWSCVATLRDASHKEVVLYIRGDSVFLPPSISLSVSFSVSMWSAGRGVVNIWPVLEWMEWSQYGTIATDMLLTGIRCTVEPL